MPQNGGSLKMHLVITIRRGILCFDSQLRDNELVCRKDKRLRRHKVMTPPLREIRVRNR